MAITGTWELSVANPIQNGNEFIFVCLEGQYLPNMHKKVLYIREQSIVYSWVGKIVS